MLAEALRLTGYSVGIPEVVSAKVSIVRANVRLVPGSPSLALDISLGEAGGVSAMPYVLAQIDCMPPLRSLVLLLKAFFKVRANLIAGIVQNP